MTSASDIACRVLYEDNHIIIVNKLPGEIVQADKTGDVTLMDTVKAFLKEKYQKPGNVFLGLPHRLDRPTSGIVVLAKTDKALGRLNEMFRLARWTRSTGQLWTGLCLQNPGRLFIIYIEMVIRTKALPITATLTARVLRLEE